MYIFSPHIIAEIIKFTYSVIMHTLTTLALRQMQALNTKLKKVLIFILFTKEEKYLNL